jgi:signal transduction histidine kinase
MLFIASVGKVSLAFGIQSLRHTFNRMGVGVIQTIEDHPFFADWSGADLAMFCKASEEIVYNKGDIIVDMGDGKYGCFFILDGEVSIIARIDGHMSEVDRRGPGEIFGEIALFTREPFIARIVASTPCTIGFISIESMDRLIGPVPPPLSKLLRSLVRHLGKTTICFVEKSVHQEKMAVVGNVVKDVVNDFQSPVQMIGLGVEAIGKLSRDKQIKNICSSITDQVMKIMKMASELAVFASSESEFKFTRVNLRAFMDEFRQQNQEIFRNNDLKIAIDAPDVDVDMEPLSMMKALHNLLCRAAYTSVEHRGHVTITARLLDETRFEISFMDDGKEIPEAIRRNFWEPFITTETGLSMSVVKGVVECHGGVINFDSKDGVGTDFIMAMPRFHVTAD